MYRLDNIFITLIFVAVGSVCYFTRLSILAENLSPLLTFLSIYFGFLITSFSIMLNSKELKKLYNKVDNEDNSINLLERLANYYKFAIFSSLMTIILVLICFFGNYNQFTFILPAFVVLILYPVKTIFKILFALFTNKKIL